RIVHSETVDFRTVDLHQTGATAKRARHQLLRRQQGHDHGVDLALQQLLHRRVVWRKLAVYLRRGDAHGVYQFFSKGGVATSGIAEHDAQPSEATAWIHVGSDEEVNDGAVHERHPTNLLQRRRLTGQAAVEREIRHVCHDVCDVDGAVLQSVETLLRVTDRHRLNRELRQAE